MKRIVLIGLPCLLAAFSAPILWNVFAAYWYASEEVAIIANTNQLSETVVSSHLNVPLDSRSNVVWCGTFQLAWNKLCTLFGEDVHFEDNEPEMVSLLNRKSFDKTSLDEASYIALADFVGNDVHGQIERKLHDHFRGQASPRLLPSREHARRPQDVAAYAYLEKNLAFIQPFEKIEKPLKFGDAWVQCFGIGNEEKQSHADMLSQIQILDYKTPKDFVIELTTASAGDRLILAKTLPSNTLAETITVIADRMATSTPLEAQSGDTFKVPTFHFDLTHSYDELLGRNLKVANPVVAKDLQVLAALQNVRFQLNENGADLRSESHLSLGCAAEPDPLQRHDMVFDKPFLVLLQRADADSPYFAMWVANAELMQLHSE